MRHVLWAYRGALLMLALVIAYDTSSATSALEGGHVHLRFPLVLFLAAVGAAIGAAASGITEARQRPPRVGPPPTS